LGNTAAALGRVYAELPQTKLAIRAVGVGEQLLAVDLAARGWRLCYVPELVVRHFHSRLRDGATRRWHLMRIALWFAWLRRPWGSAIRRTLHIVRSGKWDRAKLRALTAALAGLPWVLWKRKVLPPITEQG
jgi:hypothetical protein